MELLFGEFTKPACGSKDLSPEQVVIVQKLFAYFAFGKKNKEKSVCTPRLLSGCGVHACFQLKGGPKELDFPFRDVFSPFCAGIVAQSKCLYYNSAKKTEGCDRNGTEDPFSGRLPNALGKLRS